MALSALWLSWPAIFALMALSAYADRADAQSDMHVPTGHFKVQNPADLTASDALVVYDRLADRMSAGYRLSRDPAAEGYRRWRRYNRAPFRSATHGERYVNVYANATARDHGIFEETGPLPEGAIVVKDSFAVTQGGDVFAGALSIMEKLEEGSNPKSRDWRYAMILPDGSYFGVSDGDNSDKVGFCAACHELAGAQNDYLYAIPDEHRVSTFRLEDLLK